MSNSKHNITHRLASAFLTASLASSILTPQVSGEYFASQNIESISGDPYTPGIVAFVDTQTQGLEDIFEPMFLGETSFVAIKSPPEPTEKPPVKKRVVVSKMWLFVTAYSSTPDQTDSTPFITASNTHVREGIVAANFVRFGTKMRLPTLYGDKLFVVEDRMNKRHPYRVDIWMSTRAEAKEFGAKIVPIEIVKEI